MFFRTISCFVLLMPFVCATECEFYIAPSKYVANSRGVIVGTNNYKTLSEIEWGSAILFPCEAASDLQIENYMFSTDFDDLCMMTTGIAMSINSYVSNTAHKWIRDVVDIDVQLYYHYNTQGPVTQEVIVDNVKAGDEIFDHYGIDWFVDRDITEYKVEYTDRHRYKDLTELNNIGVCASNVVIGRTSMITLVNISNQFFWHDYAKTLPFPSEVSIDGGIVATGENDVNARASGMHLQNGLNTTHRYTDQGTGLFSKKHFKKGEIILVSPVLVIPLHSAIELGTLPLDAKHSKVTSILMNYLFVSEGSFNASGGMQEDHYSDVSLFAMGSGASANHRPSRERVPAAVEPANMEIEWFAFDTKDHKSRSKHLNNDNYDRCHDDIGSLLMENEHCRDNYIHYDLTMEEPDSVLYNRLYDVKPAELERYPYAPLDIAYRATRDIRKGEELFIDYGVEWEEAFESYVKNIQKLSGTVSDDGGDEKLLLNAAPPQFRHPMIFPKHLFPRQWIGVPCIGLNCEN